MTDVPVSQEEVEVTQADREAAASVAVLVEMRELILSGRADHHATPFARHRQQAERDVIARMEPVAVVGNNWRLLWASGETLTAIVQRTGIKIGSPLYALPTPPAGEA